jgi:hypothetical protein
MSKPQPLQVLPPNEKPKYSEAVPLTELDKYSIEEITGRTCPKPKKPYFKYDRVPNEAPGLLRSRLDELKRAKQVVNPSWWERVMKRVKKR